MNARQTILVAGDIILLYASLAFALALRTDTSLGFSDHVSPFSFLFAAWILVFYVAGCYDIQRLKNSFSFSQLFASALAVNFVLSIAFFYLLFPLFDISPKTNLIVFFGIFAIAGYYWRSVFNMVVGRHAPSLSVVFVGKSPAALELQEALNSYPQLGYRVSAIVSEDNWYEELEKLPAHKRAIVVLPSPLPNSSSFSHADYARAAYASTLTTLTDFYEYIFKRVLISELSISWLTSNIANRRTSYEKLLRPLERLGALALLIILSPLFILIGVAVALTSAGGMMYQQKRIGKNGREFTLYKFRTMRADAEKDGARWSEKNDARITPLGRVLRHSHLDELPQLFNILKGEVVFVGPRPERPEFAGELAEKIPYYDIRHLVAPGITGWAQIHYRYGSSVEDAKRKLELDLFYIKHRSLLLDVRVLLRTLKLFFVAIS